MRLPVHLFDRPDLDAGLFEIDDEVGEPLVLGLVEVGARHQHSPLRMQCPRGRDLLPVHHPFVAVSFGPARRAGQVAAGTRFAEQLAPALGPIGERGEPAALLLVGAVGHGHRCTHQHAEAGGSTQHVGITERLGDGVLVALAAGSPEPFHWPTGEAQPCLHHARPPFAQGERFVPVLRNPRSCFVVHRCPQATVSRTLPGRVRETP